MPSRTAALRSVASSRLGFIPAVLALAAGTSLGLAQNASPDGVAVSDQDLVELHVNKEDLSKVLQLLSIQSQRNIIPSPNVSGTVTADLYSVTFHEALDAILNSSGFGYLEEGNFIYVYTKEELAAIEESKRKRVAKIVRLDYLNAADATVFVESMLSGDGASISSSTETEVFKLETAGPTGADNFASESTLVIYDYEENVAAISAMIDELDTKPVQVLVEATILQTALNEANAFGMDFSILSDISFADFAGTGPLSVVNGLVAGSSTQADGTIVNPTTGVGNKTVGAVNSNLGNVAGPSTLKLGIVNEDVSVFMRVLDSVTDTTIVSNPKLLTLNRQPARVLVGQRVGYLNTTTTTASTTQSVEFLDVGTELAVRPFVSSDGLIRLELRPQVSSANLRSITDNAGNTITIPDEDTTELSTNVQVRDGQTVVLGGLFTETTTASRRQVPLLGNLPLIGAAFKGHDDSTVRSEIIFMVTPSIVNDTKLTEDGALAMEYVQHAGFGARMATLPWSREKLVGQWLIKARNYADEGKLDRAISQVRKALRLAPMSPDARALLEDLTNEKHRMPSRSILEGVLSKELLGGPLEPADGRRNGSWWKKREQAAQEQARVNQSNENTANNAARESNSDASAISGEEFSSADSDESFQQRSAVTPLFADPAPVQVSVTDETPEMEPVAMDTVATEPGTDPLFDEAPAWVEMSEQEIADASMNEPFGGEEQVSQNQVSQETNATPAQPEFVDPAFAAAFEAPAQNESFESQAFEAESADAESFEAEPVETEAAAVNTANATPAQFVPVAFVEVPVFDQDGWVYRESRPFFGDLESLNLASNEIEWVPINGASPVLAAGSEVFAGQAWIVIPDSSGGGSFRAPWPTWASATTFIGSDRYSSVFPADAVER
ncbi:MAG: type IV pilus assembly protein PilQ [Phycisphaerales bacterium]|jgi:type IV pilus assembly protein PilQ